MTKEQLQKKANHLGALLGKKLNLGQWGRKYRIEDWSNGEKPLFNPAYLPAVDLWNLLDYAEEVLYMAKQPRIG